MSRVNIIPAIDLMDGHVVRLAMGDPNRATFYNAFGDPVRVAKYWEEQGAKFLHVVDLNSALGQGNNRSLVGRILHEVHVPIQVGGGLRSLHDVQEVLDLGATRAIVGTLAIEEPRMLRRLLSEVGVDHVVVALDYVGDSVVSRGWKKGTELVLWDSFLDLFASGVRVFLLTAVSRDGLLTGPDLETLSSIAMNREVEVIAAGGVGSVEDLRRLKATGVRGVVVGRALYEGRFTLQEAKAVVES